MVQFFPGGEEQASNYTRCSHNKFTPKCPHCGRIYDYQITPNILYHRKHISCICQDGITIPNKIIRNLMEQAKKLHLIKNYQKEYLLLDENNEKRKFDMYFQALDGSEYLVEMDGGLHGYLLQKYSDTVKKFKKDISELSYADLMKNNIAKAIGIPLIRIDCYKSDVEYIKDNIYKSLLSSLIDLNSIDWNEVSDICFTNLMFEICKYKADHEDIFASEAAEIFGLDRSTINHYWKTGNKIGLCSYDSSKELSRRNKFPKNWDKQSVKVYVENIDTKESWIYNTITDFCRDSSNILDGDIMTKSMFEKRFDKTSENYIIYDTGESEYLIWKCVNKEE